VINSSLSKLSIRKSALAGLGLGLALLCFATSLEVRAAGEFKVHGLALPPGAVKIDDDRYRMPMSWDDTIRYFRNVYPPAKYTRKTLRNQNGVRAFHLTNPSSTGEWTGANVYEAAKGEVRVFVLARPGAEDSE
jgi:hypothetical protein